MLASVFGKVAVAQKGTDPPFHLLGMGGSSPPAVIRNVQSCVNMEFITYINTYELRCQIDFAIP